jgi:hypothetical protein
MVFPRKPGGSHHDDRGTPRFTSGAPCDERFHAIGATLPPEGVDSTVSSPRGEENEGTKHVIKT